MNQNEWVLIVQNSATVHYQVFDDTQKAPRPGWLRVLLKLLQPIPMSVALGIVRLGSNLYGVPLPL
jgi:hypothetical protein